MLNKQQDLYNNEIEQYLLGCILLKEDVFDDICFIKPDVFFNQTHRNIYEHIVTLKKSGGSASPHLVAQYFVDNPELKNVGGALKYFQDMMDNVITPTAAKSYAEMLNDLFVRRGLVDMADQIKELVFPLDLDISANDLLSHAEKIINDAGNNTSTDGVKHISSGLDHAMNEMINPTMGILSGLQGLDRAIKGFKGGHLYLIAGRPAMGKTAFGLTLATNVCKKTSSGDRKKALFFSLEMPHEQLTQRLCRRFGDRAKEVLETLPLYVDETAYMTVHDIMTACRRQKRVRDIDIIFIDYLGLIVGDRKLQKVHQIEEITSGLKRLSKELKIPIVLLSQLSRAVEMRDDKRPMLSDLRDSGAIEQDADVVLLLYREEYYLGDAPKLKSTDSPNKQAGMLADHAAALAACKGKAEVIVAKNRHGFSTTLQVNFSAERQEFHD